MKKKKVDKERVVRTPRGEEESEHQITQLVYFEFLFYLFLG